MPQDTNPQNLQRPILIDPRAGKSRFPKPLLWIFGCLGGCFIAFLAFIMLISAMVGLIAASNTANITENVIKEGTSQRKIAVIPVSGVIVDDINRGGLLNLGNSTTSNSKLENLLDIASNDKLVDAIILRENTPGGSTLAMRKICKKLESLSKPVYTFIESEGASAGYYIANCTKYIIADSQSITGSIGALVEASDVQGLLDKIGIRTKTITNTKGVQKESDLFEPNSNVEKKLKSILDDVYEDFIKQIVKGRNTYDGVSKISETQIRALATGEVYSGKEAKSNGLVDETGMLDDAVQTVKTRETLSSDITVVQYGFSSGFFSDVSSSIKNLLGINQLPITSATIYSIRQ